MVSYNEISSCAQQIAQRFHPEKIILFGSYAYSNPTEDSDIDLLVILPHEGKATEQAAGIRLQLHTKFPIDLIVSSPEKIKERMEMNDFFIREVMEKGRVLYEADHR